MTNGLPGLSFLLGAYQHLKIIWGTVTFLAFEEQKSLTSKLLLKDRTCAGNELRGHSKRPDVTRCMVSPDLFPRSFSWVWEDNRRTFQWEVLWVRDILS